MKTLKKLSIKAVKNTKTIKGGGIGRGTRGSTSSADNHADLL